jgi:RNA polymerase sigma-70 factor (ECF subfamily)
MPTLLESSHAHPAATLRDDEALLAAIRAGDQSAVAELYDRSGSQAFGLALRILGDRTAAEDAVQEAFVAVWRQASRLDEGRGKVTSLLMTMVHHKAIDMVRARRSHIILGDEHDTIPSRERSVADVVVAGFEGDAVRRAVALLPTEQQRVVQLAYFEGLSSTEIASVTGVPTGTVKSRMRLAMEKLRVSLDSHVGC